VSAAIDCPVSSISSARLRPIARESGTIGVEQNRPIFTPGVAKRCTIGGHHQIARGDKLTAGRRRHPFDLCDDRLWHTVDGLHELGADIEQALVERHVAADHLGQVVTRGERRARGVDDDRPHARILAQPVECGDQLFHEFEAERVALPRPVEG